MLRTLCALSLFVLSCGEMPQEGTQALIPGGRIVTQHWVPTSGVSIFRGAYDQDYSVACSFRRTKDGKMRCLPDEPLTPIVCPEGKFWTAFAADVAHGGYGLLRDDSDGAWTAWQVARSSIPATCFTPVGQVGYKGLLLLPDTLFVPGVLTP